MRRYDAVFFDAANTLLYPFPSVGTHYADVAARYGIATDATAVQRAFRQTWGQIHTRAQDDPVRYGVGEPDGRRFWRALVHATFTHIAIPDDFDAFFEELYQLFAQPTVYRLYPEVLSVLQRLRAQQYIVGVISNWDIRLEGILAGLGLMPYLDHISISAVVGWEKPHREIFHHATGAIGVAPQRALHIGDSLREDIQGADQAGLQPLWLQRQDPPATSYPVIRELSDILTWLESPRTETPHREPS